MRKPFEFTGGFTMIPDIVIDDVVPHLDPSSTLVLLVIVRATKGWSKEWDRLSLTQLELKTGLSRKTVISAINKIVGCGLILKEPFENGFNYALNKNFDVDSFREDAVKNDNEEDGNEVVENLHQWKNSTDTSGKIPPILVEKFHTQYTDIQNTKHSESAQKTRAVCDASPQWAIAHGLIPAPLPEERGFQLEVKSALDRMPQDVRALAETYMTETQRVCVSYEIAKWVKSLRQMRQQNITPDVLRDTILDMRQRGTLNTWPGSCLNLAAMKVASARRVENELPTYQPPDWWNNTPVIPTTRPNLKGPDNAG